MEKKKLSYGILVVFLLVAGGIGLSLFYGHVPMPRCGIENCHGANISCGSNIPEGCTELFVPGDQCRQYASCEIVDGECQLIKKMGFDECNSCVEKCFEDFKEDKAFQCSSECLPA